ncbi:hypothetical protein Pan161_11690 [Gimesia algae]|uniref:Uncharacterized protein n=1 Tax=Gimesia algae TaxID=2527971 RepID=A0A517V959_9PLAN|nr:hypothetical protein Pan161_11690 [Gimesia algae]
MTGKARTDMVSWNPVTLQHLIPVFRPAFTLKIQTSGKVSICEKTDTPYALAHLLPDAVFVQKHSESEGIRQSRSR